MSYQPRLMDAALRDALRRSGAVLIEGAKGCGKTSTAERVAASVVRVDVDPAVPLYLQSEPGRVLLGETPRLIDEWQRHPVLWDMVRRAVDDRRLPGQFILTGSATPRDDVPKHSGAGRFAVLRMRPMSLWEAGISRGEVSLAALRDGGADASVDAGPEDLEEWARIISRGGWPATLDYDLPDALDYVDDYLTLTAEADVSDADGVRRDPVRVARVLASLARNTSTEASVAALAADVGGAGSPLSRDTVSRYLDVLERLMVVEPLPAWQTALRDSARLRQAATWHFVDPSLSVAALRSTVGNLVAEPKTLGVLFESLAIRDLRVYAALQRGRVYHARDSAGREVDAVIEYRDGWLACEIKLGMGQVDMAAAGLNAFVAAVDTQTVGPCLAKIVIVGTGPGYRRKDGVHVVPLATLCP